MHRKQRKKSIETLLTRINEHIEKIRTSPFDDPTCHWSREVLAFARQINTKMRYVRHSKKKALEQKIEYKANEMQTPINSLHTAEEVIENLSRAEKMLRELLHKSR